MLSELNKTCDMWFLCVFMVLCVIKMCLLTRIYLWWFPEITFRFQRQDNKHMGQGQKVIGL